MRISGNSIRSINRIVGIGEGEVFRPSVPLAEISADRLLVAGFSDSPTVGDQLLPASIGPSTRFNSEGKYEVHRDQAMETAYRQRSWSWRLWNGDWQERIVEVPYQRYPRTFIEPPSIEIETAQSPDGDVILTGPECIKSAVGSADAILAVNLFLELFGFCDILRSDLQPVFAATTRRLNWQLLPPGEYPWERVEGIVRRAVHRETPQNQAVIVHRLETMAAYQPEFIATGSAGFSGYFAFGFPSRDVVVLECVHFGNATYVFNNNWEELSRLTKAEILRESLQKDRIIHRDGWDEAVQALLG